MSFICPDNSGLQCVVKHIFMCMQAITHTTNAVLYVADYYFLIVFYLCSVEK